MSAWDTDNGIALGQLATKNDEGKDVGEYNTIPTLIEQLDIKGSVVTIDAAGCYTEIVDAVVDNKGHYLITLKENQPTLMSETKKVFAEVESKDFERVACYRESTRGHGRVEERTYDAVPLPSESALREKWKNLNTLMLGIFEREVKGKKSREVRYMISDLSCDEVERLGGCFRSHWGIENRLHWVLDVSFGEDGNRTRRGNGAENLGKLRRLARGLLGGVKGKQSVPQMMFRAALSPEFRTEVVAKIAKEKF